MTVFPRDNTGWKSDGATPCDQEAVSVQTAAAAAAQLEVRQSRAAEETSLDYCALQNRMITTTMMLRIQVGLKNQKRQKWAECNFKFCPLQKTTAS